MVILRLLLLSLAASDSLALTSARGRPRLLPGAAPRHGAATATIPSAGALAAAATLPPLLGFWRSEYGVSYGYGTALAACGTLYLLPAAPSIFVFQTPLAIAHAWCLLLYGVRLNLFLLYRELTIPRFVEFRDKIEARATSKGGRISRAPFLLSCSVLYFCMAAPLRMTHGLSPASPLLRAATWGLIGLMYAGFGIAAAGDITKSYIKARQGENALVTQSVYRLLRHPNYTGEQLLWTANAALGLLGAAHIGAWGRLPLALGYALASAVGFGGISFVLMSATKNLEKKQAEKYGASRQYLDWVSGTWGGPTL